MVHGPKVRRRYKKFEDPVNNPSLEFDLDILELPFSTLELSPPYDFRFEPFDVPDVPFDVVTFEEESIVRLEVES